MNREIKKFLIRAGIFFGPILFAFVLIEAYVWTAPNSYSLKKSHLREQSGKTEVLVLGSSRSLAGINPEYFSLAGFNLANVAQTFFYDKELFLRNSADWSGLKCVLIESSYFSLGHELSDSADYCRDYYYYYFWGIRHPDLKIGSRALNCAVLATPAKVILPLFGNAPAADIRENGWEPFGDSRPLTAEIAKKRIAENEIIIKSDNYPKNIGYLKELLVGLKERGIGVAIVDLPVHASYYQLMKSDIDGKNRDIFGELCRSYGCGIFDFARDARFGDSDFGDSDHLNPAGAEKLSRIIDKEVLPAVCGK